MRWHGRVAGDAPALLEERPVVLSDRMNAPARATLIALGVGIAQIGVALVTAVALSALGFSRGGGWADPTGAARQIVVSAISLFPLVAVVLARREGLRPLGLSRDRIGRAVATGVILSLGWIAATGKIPTIGAMSGTQDIYLILLAALSVGLAEELYSRGYLQHHAVFWLGTSRGVLLPTVAFSVSHVPQRLLAGVVGLDLLVHLTTVAAIGLMLSVVMLATRHVAAPSLLHAAIDWSARL